MARQGADQLESLKDAFQTFNQMSEALMSSYHQLEDQVERLNRELAETQRQRDAAVAGAPPLMTRLHHMLDALPGAVVVLNGKGLVELANRAASELLGEPLQGEQWRRVIQRAFQPRADDGHDVSLRDGRRVSIATNSLGREPGQILLITDVTEKRQLQDKLGRFQRLSAMGQMAASLAHQVRTPTASALLYLSNLGRHRHDPEAVIKYSAKVGDQLRHIEAMVRDMLVYARGAADTQATMVRLGALSEAVIQAVAGQFEQAGAALHLDNRVPDLNIRGNPDALKGALINLLMNALYAGAKGPLEVSLQLTRHDDAAVAIRVTDNGIGMPKEVQAQVFDPFFTTRPQGTGLGLAVVKSVVEKHGGRIELVSRQGTGTEVTIILPLHADLGSESTKLQKNQTEVRL